MAFQPLRHVFEIRFIIFDKNELILLIAFVNKCLIPCLPFQISSKKSAIACQTFVHVFWTGVQIFFRKLTVPFQAFLTHLISELIIFFNGPTNGLVIVIAIPTGNAKAYNMVLPKPLASFVALFINLFQPFLKPLIRPLNQSPIALAPFPMDLPIPLNHLLIDLVNF